MRKGKAQCLAFLVNSAPASPAKKSGSKCNSKAVIMLQNLDSYLVLKGPPLQFGVPNSQSWISIILSLVAADITNSCASWKVGNSSLACPGVEQFEVCHASTKHDLPLGEGRMNSVCGV